MAKKRATLKKVSATPSRDSMFKARQIVERTNPTMRVVELPPEVDARRAATDATMPDIEQVRRKFQNPEAASPKSGKELSMFVLEPKKATDARGGPLRRTIVMDDEKEVGREG